MRKGLSIQVRCVQYQQIYLIERVTLTYLFISLEEIDVSSNNLLQSMYDTSIFTQIEESELKTPIPRKILPDRHIYLSHSMPISTGFPVLCDFDQARIGSESQHGDIMPGIYRAPEVILDMEWNEKVDIWAVGMTVRTLLTNPYELITPGDGRSRENANVFKMERHGTSLKAVRCSSHDETAY